LEEVNNELENFQIGSNMWEDKGVIFFYITNSNSKARYTIKSKVRNSVRLMIVVSMNGQIGNIIYLVNLRLLKSPKLKNNHLEVGNLGKKYSMKFKLIFFSKVMNET
jgi:hypothetical protein